MEIVIFRSAIAARSGEAVIIALFDDAPLPRCVAILKGSEEAARELAKVLGSALGIDES